MTKGYIALHRQFLNWEWYDDIIVSRLFLHCLLRANHDENKWQGKIIPRGSFVTSYDHLAKETALSIRNIRTAIKKLKSTGELTHKATSHYSIITVNNWDKWQAKRQAERQTSDKQVTTNNNDNNDNNNNIIINKSIPTKRDIEEYIYLLGKKIDVDSFISYYEASNWCDVSGLPINWKQKAVSWANRYRPRQENNVRTFKTKEEIEIERQQEILRGIHQMFENERGQK